MRSYCLDIFVTPGFDVSPPPPQDPKKWGDIISIFWINISYQIASSFDRYIGMGQRISLKYDGPIVIKIYFFHIVNTYLNLVINCFLCCTYVSTLMRS